VVALLHEGGEVSQRGHFRRVLVQLFPVDLPQVGLHSHEVLLVDVVDQGLDFGSDVHPIERQRAVVSVGPLGELPAGQVWLAEADDDIVDDIEGDFQVVLVVPFHQQQVYHSLDVLPVLQHVVGVILEDALQESTKPLEGLLVSSVEIASHWLNKLPLSLLALLLLAKVLLSQQLLDDVLEDCACKGGVDVGERSAYHLVGFLVLGNLVDEFVGKLLGKDANLFLVEAEEEGEEDVGEIDVEFGLVAL
jgi:hypothetical protein